MRDAAFGCDWVGTPIPFQRCLMFIIATTNKEFKLTAGKFVPVSNVTTMNVCIYVIMESYMIQLVTNRIILYNLACERIRLNSSVYSSSNYCY